MLSGIRRAATQFSHLAHETRRMVGSSPWRWGNVWFTSSFAAVASYRLDRAAYVACGSLWPVARLALSPALFVLRPWGGGCDIHYKADIGRGLIVLHPALGVVISGKTVAGKNLLLTGGNCIGMRKAEGDAGVRLGDDVSLGANASILGPARIGDRVRIGAHAIALRDTASDDVVLAPQSSVRAHVD